MGNEKREPNDQSIKYLQTFVRTGRKKSKNPFFNFLALKSMLRKNWNINTRKNLLA